MKLFYTGNFLTQMINHLTPYTALSLFINIIPDCSCDLFFEHIFWFIAEQLESDVPVNMIRCAFLIFISTRQALNDAYNIPTLCVDRILLLI